MAALIVLIVGAGALSGFLHFLLIRRVEALLETRHPALLADLQKGRLNALGAVTGFARGRRDKGVDDTELNRLCAHVQLTWRLALVLWALSLAAIVIGTNRHWL
jgi:hypothetical protein